jgi:hypothetical protein
MEVFMADVHVIYKGRTDDISIDQLFPAERRVALGIAPDTVLSSSNVTEAQVKNALAQWYDVGVGEFDDLFVEMNPNGNVTVRPNTPFGS